MIELDGVARRMLLCPPDLDPGRIPALLSDAEIDAIVTDRPDQFDDDTQLVVGVGLPERAAVGWRTERATEWLMLTSGTSGPPKIVGHTLDGLAGAIMAEGSARHLNATWGTFYDIRSYGGLQIFLRAVIGGGSMVLSSKPGEAIADYVARLHASGVTYIFGTPSHWRKLLMSGTAADFSPRYVRLFQRNRRPGGARRLGTCVSASIGHAYASTEAGGRFRGQRRARGFSRRSHRAES
jgi:acyl-coenzyme A synthetase/AMP-(fatty) acid ligase